MADFSLRPARKEDLVVIRNIIHRVGINPTGLDWRRFWLADDDDGTVLGCGQIKPHSGGALELASIAVQPDHQNRGIGTALIGELLQRGSRPLYLMCRPSLGSYYERFGFRRLGLREMPSYFRKLRQILLAYEHLSRSPETLLVMKLK